MSFIHYKYKQMTISVSWPSLYWLKKVAYMFWKAIESQFHLAVCSIVVCVCPASPSSHTDCSSYNFVSYHFVLELVLMFFINYEKNSYLLKKIMKRCRITCTLSEIVI